VRVAVISDTHMPRGSRALSHDCLARLAAADLVLHAGDLTSVSFLEQLRVIGPPVEAVHGNVDESLLQAMLPAERVLEVGELRVGMLHDAGRRDGRVARLVARFPGCAAVVYGHSHLPEIARAGSVWILNPGSPTERRRAPARTMIELDVSGEAIRPKLVTFDP
jgi:uncharacterized protein